jgi:hypothetical protein
LFPRWVKALIRVFIPWRQRQKPGHPADGPLFFEASTTFDQKDKMRAFDRRRIRYLIRADLAWRKNSGRSAAT